MAIYCRTLAAKLYQFRRQTMAYSPEKTSKSDGAVIKVRLILHIGSCQNRLLSVSLSYMYYSANDLLIPILKQATRTTVIAAMILEPSRSILS